MESRKGKEGTSASQYPEIATEGHRQGRKHDNEPRSVGRSARPVSALGPSPPAGCGAGRSVGTPRGGPPARLGHFDPISFAALRAAGRSIGADRVVNANNRKKGSIGQGRRVHFQLGTPPYNSCGLSVDNCEMSSPRNATRAATYPHRQQLQIAGTRHEVTRKRRRDGTSQTQSGDVGSQGYGFAPLPAWSTASLSTHD